MHLKECSNKWGKLLNYKEKWTNPQLQLETSTILYHWWGKQTKKINKNIKQMIYRRLSTKLTFLEHSTQQGQDSLFKHVWNILQDGPSLSRKINPNKLKK